MGFKSAALMGGLSAFAIGLIHLGILKEEALKYESPIKAVVSPDHKTLLVQTSGYNLYNYTSGANAGNDSGCSA